MPHHEAVAAAGEAAIGDQRDIGAQALAHQRRGGAQHLAHAGSAAGTLVANHQHITLDHAAVENRLQRLFLGMEHARRTRETQAFLAGDLRHRTLGCQVAAQDHQVAVALDRVVEGANDIL